MGKKKAAQASSQKNQHAANYSTPIAMEVTP